MIASNDILSNPADFTPPMPTSLFYAARCKAGVTIAYGMKSAEFLSECGRAKCFFSQSSKPNELILNTLFYDSVCLTGSHG